MDIRKGAKALFSDWYSNLKLYKDKFPARGSISGALVVLERLKEDFVLDLDDHTTKGGSQVKGASGEAIKRVLESFGETRPFVKEGGRTNRGLRGDIGNMLDAIKAAELDNLPVDERNGILEELQEFLVGKVDEFHRKQRLKIVYDPSRSTWHSIYNLLVLGREKGSEGPVAQYLVGAKLQLRFPGIEIRNESYSAADEQSGQSGDFEVGDTVFHITVAPSLGHYDKCKSNIESGLRPYLLVPDRILMGTRQNAEAKTPGRIAVESIESFVSQNIEELSTFRKSDLTEGFRSLLETYNERVDAAEIDKSMLIEIPRNLQV